MVAVLDENTRASSRIFSSKLGREYLDTDSEIVSNPLFESGVAKVQEGKAEELNRGEKRAISCLQLDSAEIDQQSVSTTGKAASLPMKERLSSAKKINYSEEVHESLGMSFSTK